MNTHQDPYLFDDEAENHRIGKKLYHRPDQRREDRPNRPTHQSSWDEGNHFHTGPSQHGSQQYYREQQRRQQQQQHYGRRNDSTYRHPESKINFGDHRSSDQQTAYDRYRPYYSDESHFRHEPSDRDRYKANDYRYRSGHYNWNSVNVNPHDYDADDRNRERNRQGHRSQQHDRDHEEGFFSRITHGLKDAWHTVTHRQDEEDYKYRNEQGRHDYRSGYDPNQDSGHRFSRGYESGPHWADEHRSHHDQNARDRWPEDPTHNRRGQKHGYNPDPNNDW